MDEVTRTEPAEDASLHGRTALVTGGSRGIGRAVALRLARHGATVAVNYRRDHDAAAGVVDEIRRAGGHAVAVAGSVADPAETGDIVERVNAGVGPVDLVVSNAGTASRGRSVSETAPSEFHDQLAVHALGPLGLIVRLLPQLRAAERADVIMVSSVLTRTAPPGAAPYVMAKAAMEAAMRTLAHEERRHGIRANIVAPGLVATEMGSRLVAASTAGLNVDDLNSHYPFGRVCLPEDVAAVVAFLASGSASYITGQRITVDGDGPGNGIVSSPTAGSAPP